MNSMIVDELKKAILEYAIQGKLTKQLDTDTDINVTYNLIQNERKKRLDSKKITKSQYSVPNNDENYPKGYPDNWKLTQIGYLGYVVGGGTPSTSNKDYWGNEISWITPNDMKNYSTKYIDVGKRSITKIGYKNSSAQLVPKGSVLCSSRAPIGYLGIATNELTTNQGFKTIVPLGNLNSEYIYYYLFAIVDTLKKSGDGTTFSEISGADFAKQWIVLPPIEEQQRIVDKIEELFSLLDKLKNTEVELNAIKNNFSKDIKKSIYNYYFKKDDKITKSKLQDLINFANIKNHNAGTYNYLEAKYLRGTSGGKKIDQGKFIEKGTYAILVDGENSGEVFHIMEDGYLGSTFRKIEFSEKVYIKYMVHFLNFKKEYFKNNKRGAAIPHLDKKIFFDTDVYLPSIEEQQRIVEKLDYILPLIESL